MPLGTSLKDDIQSLSEDPGENAAECAAAWADILGPYVSGIVPPANPAGLEAASGALQASLVSAFSAGPGAGLALLETAFLTFATAIAAAMAPAFVGVPPAGQVGFATLVPTTEFEVAATALATKIDVWFRTGSATPSIGGSPVPWS